MGPIFRSINVTVVDFLGIFVPGVAWTVVLSEIFLVFSSILSRDFCNKRNIILKSTVEVIQAQSPPTPVQIFTFVTFSIILGYALKVIELLYVERIAAFMAMFYNRFLFIDDKFKLPNDTTSQEPEFHKKIFLRFPYNKYYKHMSYFSQVKTLVGRVTSYDPDKLDDPNEPEYNKLPGTQPFASCKRLLRLYCPNLWDEVITYEAQVRLMGSTLSAAAGFLIYTIIYIALYKLQCNIFRSTDVLILISSFISCLFLAYGFRKIRRVEVKYMYLKIVIAKKFILRQIAEHERPKFS